MNDKKRCSWDGCNEATRARTDLCPHHHRLSKELNKDYSDFAQRHYSHGTLLKPGCKYTDIWNNEEWIAAYKVLGELLVETKGEPQIGNGRWVGSWHECSKSVAGQDGKWEVEINKLLPPLHKNLMTTPIMRVRGNRGIGLGNSEVTAIGLYSPTPLERIDNISNLPFWFHLYGAAPTGPDYSVEEWFLLDSMDPIIRHIP